MTKRSTRVASFIMAVIMLLVSVLFTEFGTIKVSAGSTDAGTITGNAHTTTTGAAARQDYLIRVFPIPNKLTDYNAKGAQYYKGVMQRITANGWQATIGSTTEKNPTSELGKYRTLGYSAWIHPRDCSIAPIYSDYENGSFKGYATKSITSKSLVTTSEIDKDAFTSLFSGLDKDSLGDTWYGGESEISEIIENNVKAYKSGHASNESSMLTSFEKYITNATDFQKLIDTGKVTLGFEIYVGMSQDGGSTTSSYISVTALQDYAKAKSNAVAKATGNKASGSFSASDKFADAYADDFFFALFWSFPLAYNSLLPAYYTSSTWYEVEGSTGQRIPDEKTGYYYGGGGWCFYSFKVPTGTVKVVPVETTLKIPVQKFVKLSDGSTAPSEAQTNVRIGYSISPSTLTKISAATAAKAYADAAKAATGSSSYKYAVDRVSEMKQPGYVAGSLAATQEASASGQSIISNATVITKKQRATISEKVTLITDKHNKAQTSYFVVPIWEQEIMNGETTVGSWCAKPVGVIVAKCAVDDKGNFNWSYSFASVTGNSNLYAQPKERTKLGTMSWTSGKVAITNYYSISRQTVIAQYPLFNFTAEDKAVLTYDATAWKGSALISNNTDAKRTMYTRKVNLTNAEENSVGGLLSTYRFLKEKQGTYTWNYAYLSKKLWTADFDHSDKDSLKRAKSLTVNAPKAGTVYSNSAESVVSYAVSGEKSFVFTGIASLNTSDFLYKSADTTAITWWKAKDAQWKTGGTTVSFTAGKTYALDTTAKTIRRWNDATKVLIDAGKYARQYAAYEALANRNYLELSKVWDYYVKQVLHLEDTLKTTHTDSTEYANAKKALTSLTGYTIVRKNGKIVATGITGKSYAKILATPYASGTGQYLSSRRYLNTPSTDSVLGKFAKSWGTYAEQLHTIEKNRPYIKFTVSTAYNATDKNTDAKKAVVPEYYLSMKWTSPKHFLTSGTKLRTTVYDYNANTALERFTIQTTPEMIITGKSSKSFTFRRLVYNSPSAFYTSYSKLKEADDKISKLAELDTLLHKDITIDDKSTNGSRFDLALGNNYAPTAAVSRALDAHIDTADYFKTYSSIWQIQNSPTDATKTYLPTNAWTKAWGITSPVNTGIVPATAYKNKGAVSKTTSVSGSNMIRIYAANGYTESNKSAYKRFASSAVLSDKLKDKNIETFTLLTLNKLPSGYTGTALVPAASGVEMDTSWGRQSTVYKLSAQFSKYQSGAVTPTTITKGTENKANMYSGWFERTNTTISINPLVKIAYYSKNFSTPAKPEYTYVAGTQLRKVPATTYYTVSVKADSKDTPTATALALASDSRALGLSQRVAGNRTTPIAYSGTGVQISDTGNATLDVKVYSLINVDADEPYQSGWGNTKEDSSILTTLLKDGSLGFESKTYTDTNTNKPYTGITYSNAYTVQLGDNTKTWDMKATSGGVAFAKDGIRTSLYSLKIAGGQVVEISINDSTISANKEIKDPITTNNLPATTYILSEVKKAYGDLYTAMIKMGITGNPKTDILYKAFAHNAGAKVEPDANEKKADGLLLGGGENWYNEYCNCLAIKMETISYSLNSKPVIDKIPIEAGPAQPTDKSKYFTSGYKFTVTKRKIKIGSKIVIENSFDPKTQFIVADVPVTAAH